MFLRILSVLILLLAGYIIYDSARVAIALSSADNAAEGYYFAPEGQDADINVVAYIDYSCVSCRELHPLLDKAIQDDGKVKLIPRPIASKGLDMPEASAAKLVYAAAMQKPEMFTEAHHRFMHEYRVVDSMYISDFALHYALDSVQLEKDMESPEVLDALQDNFDNLEALKGKVLPTLLVNGEIMVHVNGVLPSSTLLGDLFNTARSL